MPGTHSFQMTLEIDEICENVKYMGDKEHT